MSMILGGRPAVDPATLDAELTAAGVSTARWRDRAGTFTLPLGHGPGRGWVLLRLADLERIDAAADHDLVISGSDADHVVTLSPITLLRTECVSPGSETDPAAVYFCEVVDRRHFLAMVPVDAAYNLRKPDGTDDYLTDSLNGASPWTWQEVVTDLAETLGIDPLALPFTPEGTPESLAFRPPYSAWDALCAVLDRLACAVKYDPAADTFEVVRLGTADPTFAAAEAALAGVRLWDGYSAEAARGWYPESAWVVFRRVPAPTEGTSPVHVEVVALPAVAGTVAGTAVQLADDEVARGATGAPANAAALATRAAERAADWVRARAVPPLLRVYRDFQAAAALLGPLVRAVVYDDRGGPFATALRDDPAAARALELWTPPPPPPPPPGTPTPTPSVLIGYPPGSGYTPYALFGLRVYVVGGVSIIGVNNGCGLYFTAAGKLAVDVDQLVGNRTVTGLVTGPDFLLCPTIANDYVVDRADAQTVVTSDTTTFACCTETRTQVTVTNTYYFNAANELIFWAAGVPVTTVTTVDFCAKVKCCFAAALGVLAEADPIFGEPDLDVDFASTVTGGVGPFTYSWKIGGVEFSTSANPSHTFTTPGQHAVTVTVTDTTCNCPVTTTVYVYVTVGTCACPGDCPNGAPERYTFMLAGGTGDFAGANGSWTMYHTGACEWTGDLNGWTAGGTGAGVTVTDTTHLVRYEGTPVPDDCCSSVSVAEASHLGTGTRPTSPFDIDAADVCGPCYATVACCPDPVVTRLNVTLTGGTCSGTSTVTWNGTNWQGDITLTGGTGGTLHATLSCSGSTWSASFTGCDTFGGTVTGTCSPFDRSSIPFATICCGGGSMTARFFE